MAITLTSSAFADDALIPRRHTCDGEDVSPPLALTGIPDGTQSVALICDDPDAPVGTWVHWVLFNLPADLVELPAGIPGDEILSNGAKHGKNDFGKLGYGGPCPPGGTHRYFFKVYALDTKVSLAGGASKDMLLKAMEGHILAEGRLMGKYRR